MASSTATPDAIVVGAGPNGLAAAISLAQAGKSVHVIERSSTIGGGCRTAELTLPGVLHDPCSAIHPLGLASPFFRTLPLEQHGLEWIHPTVPLAHPLDDGTAVLLHRSVDETAAGLGADGDSYRSLFQPIVESSDAIIQQLLGPFHLPRHPIQLLRFGLGAIRSTTGLAERKFKGDRARAMFAGLGAHSILPLESPTSAGFGLMLGLLGHTVGWPLPRGGAQRFMDALAAHFSALGGTIETDSPVTSMDDVAGAEAVLFDLTPRQLVGIAGDDLPESYRKRLGRFRYGAGVFKIDWALDGPVPWTAQDCLLAGTVHVGGRMEEIAEAERAVGNGKAPQKPFVLLAQQSLFDPTRAPAGIQTLWGYCHVPNGCREDMTERIEAQIERFAPGFTRRIIARSVTSPDEMEAYNPNYIGGDINGGIQDIRQLFTRPIIQRDPYSTPNCRIYLCSSSTPPGGGVHGMAGFHAAQSALRRAW